MQDVFVEHADATAVVVVTDVPLPRNEALLMELPRDFGTRTVVPVQVAKSGIVWHGEMRRHRTVLRVERPSQPVESASVELEQPASAGSRSPLPAIGVLVRRVPVCIRDVSASGCLLESADVLPEGSVGLLEIAMHGQRHTETLRVCRSNRMPGSTSGWRSGANFLALNAPPPTSVRNIVARFEIIDELGEMPDTLARMYRRLPPPPMQVATPTPPAPTRASESAPAAEL